VTRAFPIFAALAACYAPAPQPGSPCDNAPCPSGLVCSPATRVCELPGGSGGDAGTGGDGGGGDAEAGTRCYGTGILKLCLAAPPDRSVLLNGTLNTDTSTMCAPYDGTGLCVVAGTEVGVTSNLRATGSRPLVLISAGSIAITGTLDVASRRVGTAVSVGAGATSAATCTGATAPMLKAGGPGGSFGGRGGDGGIGDGGPAAAAPVPAAPAVLRGGCAGLAGAGTSPGGGGAGGGAVYLIAGSDIGLTGSINASGAAGGGGPSEGGGGGGGSGGMIGLDAPSIIINGAVFANGGGGGEGGGAAAGNDGANVVMPTAPAAGGSGGAPNGGDGGAGAYGAILAGGRGGDNTSSAGGGGGGGGAGLIAVFGSLISMGPISPPPR